jgi:histidine triad (HIT) family protein
MLDRDCVFCKIIDGQIEASIVYENEAVVAIMDRHQANPGHVLVIPKQHVQDIYALSMETGTAIIHCVITVSRAVKQAFDVEGLNVWQSNGACAGQEIPHVHFHIQPRKDGDGLLRVYASKPNRPAREALDAYAQKIQACF